MKYSGIKPVVTEKSLALAAKGWYTFAIDEAVSKSQAAAEISAAFKVDVITVRSIHMHGKVRRFGKKMNAVRQTDWKKALVKLKAGQKIDAFEVTSQEEQPKAK